MSHIPFVENVTDNDSRTKPRAKHDETGFRELTLECLNYNGKHRFTYSCLSIRTVLLISCVSGDLSAKRCCSLLLLVR